MVKIVKTNLSKTMTKNKSKNISNPNGRPTIMTPETVKKLKEGFAQGFSVDNAWIWADISKQTYYTYCEKEAGFLDHCKTLQKKPLIKSILVINKALNEGDVSTAKWYAERKAKDEFSLRNELTGEDGKAIENNVNIKVKFVDGNSNTQ